jgi:hypothetical protein
MYITLTSFSMPYVASTGATGCGTAPLHVCPSARRKFTTRQERPPGPSSPSPSSPPVVASQIHRWPESLPLTTYSSRGPKNDTDLRNVA